jgi:fermentation-respiration switch protein FrsA (DUF1100 family)
MRSFLRRTVSGALLLAVLGAAWTASHLREDKRPVILDLARGLGEARVVERSATAASEARLVALANGRGEEIASVWIRRPQRLAADHRIVLVYSGEKTGRRILDLIPERDDVVLAAPQYPYERPHGALEHLRWPYDLRRAAFATIAGGMLTVSHLERDEGLDSRRLLAIGASLGTPFAVIHAALDPRVPRVLIVHGGGDLPRVVRAIETRRGRPWRAWIEGALAEVLLESFEPLDYVAEIAPRELVVIGARGDHLFPAASTQALFDRARQPKSLRWTSGDHLRSTRTEALEEVLAEIDRLLVEPPRAPVEP